jgi:hypothetical protein
MLVLGSVSEGRAFTDQRAPDLSIRPLDLHLGESGPLEVALGGEHSLRRGLDPTQTPELSIRAGNVGLSLRPENGRLRPDMFYDLSGWKLRTRIMSGDSPLEIDGMVLRAAHAFPLFGPTSGSADLP